MPDELWTEVRDIVEETGIKTIPMEKKCKKAKWLSKEALQIPEERQDTTGKGQKERCTHLNAEFQRIARRDKKPSSVINAKKQRKNNGVLLSIKKNTFESVLMRWMKLEPIIQSEVSQKEKHQ